MSGRRGGIFTGNYSYSPELRAELDEYLQPMYKDGEMLLEVECGENRGLMYVSRLCQGSKGPCVLFQDNWLTPNEFQYISGRETAKDWKRSIRHKGRSIKLLLTKGILSVHPSTCDCDGCRISSPVHKTRLTKKKLPEFNEYARMRLGMDAVSLERAPCNAPFSLAELWKQQEKQFESLRETRLTQIINQLRKSKEKIENIPDERLQSSIKGATDDHCVSETEKARMLDNSSAPGNLEPSRTDESTDGSTTTQRPQSVPSHVMLQPMGNTPGIHKPIPKIDPRMPKEQRLNSGLVLLANEAHARAMESGNCSSLIRQLAEQHCKLESAQKHGSERVSMVNGDAVIPRLPPPHCLEMGRYAAHEFYPALHPSLVPTVYQPPSRNGFHSQGRLLEIRRPPTTLQDYHDALKQRPLSPMKRPLSQEEDAPVDLSLKRIKRDCPQDRFSAFDAIHSGPNELQTTKYQHVPALKSERHVDLNDNVSSVPHGRETLRDYLHDGSLCPRMTEGQQNMVKQMQYWSADDVVDFIKTFQDCEEYVETFREQRIDGHSLRLLSVDLLTGSLGMKLGPALNLRAFIAKLSGQCDQCRHCLHCHQTESEN